MTDPETNHRHCQDSRQHELEIVAASARRLLDAADAAERGEFAEHVLDRE